MMTTEDQQEPGLELAPADGAAPNFERVQYSFREAVTDCGWVVSAGSANESVRYAQWAGQTDDGKKHSREGDATQPTPWEGASDQRVFLVDEAVNAKVAMVWTALKQANLVAVPIEGTDMARARSVTSFMRWLIYTQVPQLDRESELLAQYVYEKGVALCGVFWETCEEKVLQTIRIEELAKQLPQITDLLADPSLEDTFIAMIQEAFPGVGRAKAKRMLKELNRDGETSIPVVGPKYSRPVIRAFALDRDVFIHPSATDIENAPGIFRIQYYTPAQLRSFVNTEGWDANWVEAAIETCKGVQISELPEYNSLQTSRNTLDQADRFTDLIGVVYAYERLSDEDGVPGIYLSIFNPQLPASIEQGHEGFAKFGLLGYRQGKYPFVLFRREFLSRQLHDSRGLPEVGKGYQNVVKACTDGRNDAMSLSVCPPLMVPMGRPVGRYGPGSQIQYRRSPDEISFGDRPAYDLNTTTVEDRQLARWREYCGFATPDGDPGNARSKQQFDVAKWLSAWSDVFKQAWALYQQYGKDEQYFRVIGVSSQEMVRFQKGDPNENYDFYLTYDVINNDPELSAAKWEQLAKLVTTFDRNGQTDFSELLAIAVSAVDPAVAERIIQPKETATAKAVDEIQTLFTKAFAGNDVDFKEGMPPELGLQMLQGYVMAPDVQSRLAQDEVFRKRLEKLQKQMQFQITQRKNAQIGRLGA